MRLASFLLFLALPQAQATQDDSFDTFLVVESTCESTCTKESKTCKALFKKEDLPKGKECGKPPAGLKWKVPESVPKEYQKEAKALAEKANKDELKGFCYKTLCPREF